MIEKGFASLNKKLEKGCTMLKEEVFKIFGSKKEKKALPSIP
jgi:hypothetical protein